MHVGDDSQWRKLLDRAYGLDEAHVKVGVLASKGGNEVHDPESGLTLIEIAAIHEFGSPEANIPQRSFILMTLAAHEEELNEVIAKLARAVVTQGWEVERALNVLGAWVVAKIRNAMTGVGDFIPLWDPLKPATIAAKGSDAPLIDTGRLMQAIQWEISNGSGEESAGA